MTKLFAVLALCALFCGPLLAQDTPPKPEEKPAEKPSEKPEEKPPEKPAEKPEEAPTTLGLSADLNVFIKKVYPELDPAGEHDIFNLKNYTDAAKRHEYTGAMSRLIVLYVTRLDLGATISKLFDQYSRGKLGSQPTFKVLHAVQMLQYPPGTNNWPEAEKLLREAGALATDYAYPWYFLGEVEIAKLRSGLVSSNQGAMEVVDNALRIRPDFFQAVLLKSDLLMVARPSREAEAVKILEPLLAKDAPSAADLENLLTVYGRVASQDSMLKHIDAIMARASTSRQLKASAAIIAAAANKHVMNLDGSLEWVGKARANIDEKVDPEAAVRAARFSAELWGMKAVRIREKNPKLTGDDQKLFDGCVAEARKGFLDAASLETEHMPIELRGQEAARYVTFLTSIGELEDALLWLEEYLDSTDLPASMRNRLESMRLQIRTRIDPNEEILIEQYEDLLSRGEDENLVIALDGARGNLELKGIHFKAPRSLKFFVTALTHKDRRVVELAAQLAADTARTIGGESIAEAGKALADRLEQEIECKSDQQSQLQVALCRAILLTDTRGTGHAPSQARACRHLKKLLEGVTEGSIALPLSRVVNTFLNKDFLAAVKDAPQPPGSLDRRKPAKVSEWLGKLAEVLEKSAAEPK